MKFIALALLERFNRYCKITALLILAFSDPELWKGDNFEDDFDDDIILFYQTLIGAFLNTNLVFLKLCQIFDIYSTRPCDLLTQYGNYAHE